MKPITETSVYRTGPKLNPLREQHPDFVEKHLVFGSGFKVESVKVSRLYLKFIGGDYSTIDVRNLYIGLVKKHGVTIKKNTLIGVKIK